MLDVDKVLDEAGLKNPKVREYVTYWAGITEPDRIEVVNASDDARLVAEALEAGELLPAGEGLYYSRSYFKDTARSEERTIVATQQARGQGRLQQLARRRRDDGQPARADARAVAAARRCTSSPT